MLTSRTSGSVALVVTQQQILDPTLLIRNCDGEDISASLCKNIGLCWFLFNIFTKLHH